MIAHGAVIRPVWPADPFQNLDWPSDRPINRFLRVNGERKKAELRLAVTSLCMRGAGGFQHSDPDPSLTVRGVPASVCLGLYYARPKNSPTSLRKQSIVSSLLANSLIVISSRPTRHRHVSPNAE